MSSLTQLLRAVKERLERATPGPWTLYKNTCVIRGPLKTDGAITCEDDCPDPIVPSGSKREQANLELITHAPTDLAKLLRICEVQREALGMVDHVGMPAPYASHVRAAIEQADAIAAEGGET